MNSFSNIRVLRLTLTFVVMLISGCAQPIEREQSPMPSQAELQGKKSGVVVISATWAEKIGWFPERHYGMRIRVRNVDTDEIFELDTRIDRQLVVDQKPHAFILSEGKYTIDGLLTLSQSKSTAYQHLVSLPAKDFIVFNVSAGEVVDLGVAEFKGMPTVDTDEFDGEWHAIVSENRAAASNEVSRRGGSPTEMVSRSIKLPRSLAAEQRDTTYKLYRSLTNAERAYGNRKS